MPVPDPFADLTGGAVATPDADPFADLIPQRNPKPGPAGAQIVQRPTAGDRLKAIAAAPAAALDATGGALARAATGVGNFAGVVSDDTLAQVNDYENKRALMRESILSAVPGLTTGTELVGQAVPFLNPVGAVLGPATVAGEGYAGAREGGATKGQAAASGALQGVAAAALPVISRTVAPLTRPLGQTIAGRTAQGVAQGAVGGVVQGGAGVAGTSIYDPEAARQQLSDIPRQAALFGLIGGAHGAMARPTTAEPFKDLTPAEVDPNAVTQEMKPLSVDQLVSEGWTPPPGWDPRIGSPKRLVAPGDVTSYPASRAADIDAGRRRLDVIKRIRATGEPTVGPEQTAEMDPVAVGGDTQDRILTQDVNAPPRLMNSNLASEPAPVGDTMDQIRTQANARPWPRQEQPEAPTYSTGELSPVEQVQVKGASELAAAKNAADRMRRVDADIAEGQAQEAARQEAGARQLQRVQQEEQPQSSGQTGVIDTAEVMRATADKLKQKQDELKRWAIGFLNEGRPPEERIPLPPEEPSPLTIGRFPTIDKNGRSAVPPPRPHQPEPTLAERAAADEAEAIAEPPPAAPEPIRGAPEAAPAVPSKPLAVGDRVSVGLKGHPFEARIDEVRPDGRYRLTSADGRTFPAVDPSKVTRLEKPNAAPANPSKPVPQKPVSASPAASRPVPAKSTAQAAESSAPRLSGDAFRKQLDALPINKRTPGLTDAIMKITEARAESAGVSLDEYVGRRIARVETAGTAPTLKQRANTAEGQTDNGAVKFLSDGRAIIRAFENANESTALHELAHIFRRDLAGDDLEAAAKWAGAREGKWGRAAEEKFARGFERYVREGVSPTPELRPVFQRFYDWLKSVYQAIKGSPIDVEVSPAMKRLFSRLLTPEEMKGLPDAKAAEEAPAAPATPEQRAERLAKLKALRGESPNAPPKTEAPKPSQPAPEPKQGPAEEPRDLANYAEKQSVRDKIDEMDAEREKPEVHHRKDIEAEADKALTENSAKIRSEILRKAEAGEALSELETAAAKKMAAREIEKAMVSGDPAQMAQAQALHMAYRDTGTAAGRILGMRYDPTMTKGQRAKQMLTDALVTPARKFTRQMDAAKERMQKASKEQNRPEYAKAKAELMRLKREAAADLKRVREALQKEGVDLLFQAEEPDPVKAIAVINRIMQHKDGTRNGVAREWYANALLSAVRTVTTNIVGSPLNAARILMANRTVEALINLIARHDDAATFSEAKHMMAGIGDGVRQAWSDAIATWKVERSVFRGELAEREHEQDIQSHISGRKGRIIRIPSRISKAADQFWKTWISYVDVGAQAHRIAKSAGLEGEELGQRIRELVADHESPAWERAMDTADRATFNEKAGKLTDMAMRLRDYELGEGTDFRPAFYMLPFVRTPANILKQGFKMTPAGLPVMAARILRSKFGGKEYSRSDLMRDAAEQVIGFAASGILLGMATATDDEGMPLITGSMEGYDQGTKDALRRSQIEPYSARLFGSRVSYRNLEPFATAVGTTVDMIQSMANKNKDGGKVFGAVKDAVLGQVTSKTYLKTIADIRDAMSKQGSGKAVQMAMNFANAWVPNIIEASQRDFDPFIRDQAPHGHGLDYWKEAGYTLAAQAFVPWAQNKAVDLWGRDMVKNESGPLTSAVANILRPISPVGARAAVEPADLDRLILNWNNTCPSGKEYAPRPPQRTYGQDQYMPKDVYERYSRKAGALAFERLSGAGLNVDHPTEHDMDRIRRELRRARAQVRRELLNGDTASPDDQ